MTIGTAEVARIQLRQGAAGDLASAENPQEGEPHWTTDEQTLFIWSAVLSQMIQVATYETDGCLQLPVFTDATRPAAGTAGRLIFNSDDGQLNIDSGTNWTLPDGTVT